MLFQVYTENGVKKIKYLTADTGTGAPVGSYLMLEKKSNPQGYLYCDGSTFDSSVYPALYQYLGTNVLPDFREFSPVGAEQNTTNVYDASTNPNGVIHDHDVYTEGEAKDDQLQNHNHKLENYIGYASNANSGNTLGVAASSTTSNIQATEITSGRSGTVTRGKRKAVFVYIKATSGLTENQQENVLNTINENLSYSTTEHKTGKKWIDGKDIWQKVLHTGQLPNTATLQPQHGITNLDKITDIKGVAYRADGVQIPIPFISSGGAFVVCNIYASVVQVTANADYSSYIDSYVILEYTKTT